jgi:outer membrane protein OmpA-like peptidoglycan-associated protein
MHSDGKTLFFSSKGHSTLGGYDVFKTVYENDEWSKPINLGSPINTSDDELFFNLNQEGNFGIYCSNRGVTSKNIFTINLIAKNQLNVKSTKFKLKGIVVDPSTKEPVEAKIMVFDASTNELVATVKSDIETGKYSVVLPTEKKYILSVSTPKYMFNSSLLSAEETDNVIEIKKDFDLTKIIKGATITSNFIDFDAESNVLPSSKTEMLRIFQLLAENPKLTIEIVSHTDVEGDFGQNQIISNKRAKAILDYLVLEGIPKDRMKSSGLGESKPIYSEAEILKQPKEKQKELRFLNQRTEINVLIF